MTNDEPSRVSPGGALSQKMATLARADTAPELALRREASWHGSAVSTSASRTWKSTKTELTSRFTRQKIAVFIDGCYWHGCPQHGTRPVANREWWDWKIQRNRDRDSDTNRLLEEQGWRVVRVWEHEEPSTAAARVAVVVRESPN